MLFLQVKASFIPGQLKLFKKHKKMPSPKKGRHFFEIKRSFLHATALLCQQTFL